MIRALAIACALTAAPVMAAACDTVGDGVLFCGEGPWAGEAGQYDAEMGVTLYFSGSLMMLTGPLPPFASDIWVGSNGDIARTLDSFPAQEGQSAMARPRILAEDVAGASLVYMAQPNLVSLITLLDLSGLPHIVQTAESGTEINALHREMHLAALNALVEDDL